MFGTKEFPQVGYPTPTELPSETTCLTLFIPANDEWWGLVTGLLYSLSVEWTWQQYEGGITRDEAAARWQSMIEDALDTAATSDTCTIVTEAETPFWDDATDVDDSAPSDMQTWYGTFSDVTAPPGELDFVENLLVWAFSGLLAVGVAPKVGIAFQTIATKFVIAQRAGDVGEIIRIVVDGATDLFVDTSGRAGEIIETPIYADPSVDLHQIYIMKVS